MILNNTTNIDSRLIQAIFSFVKPENIGKHIRELKLRNKKEGMKYGQWGWHKPLDGYVSIIVPREWHPHEVTLRVTKQKIWVESRAEMIVATLAHELRHAWQFANEKQVYRNKRLAEVDAELYEAVMLERWQDHIAELREMRNAASHV